MNVQEAISCLKADKEYLVDMKVCDGEEMDIAIKALEEIQQYRAIGTVEEFREAVARMHPMKPIQTGIGEGWKCAKCGAELH